jgi:hypothetical protein
MTTQHRTQCTWHHEQELTGRDSFGLVDAKGRAIGAVWRIVPVTFEPIETEAFGWYGHAPGHYYAAHVQPTRDGKPFGATQPDRMCSALEAARSKVEALIEASRKRYARQAGTWRKVSR